MIPANETFSGYDGHDTMVPAFLRQFDESTLQAPLQRVSISAEEMRVELRLAEADAGAEESERGGEEADTEASNQIRADETFNKIRLGNFEFVSLLPLTGVDPDWRGDPGLTGLQKGETRGYKNVSSGSNRRHSVSY